MDAEAYFDISGNVLPTVFWKDETRYDIDRVLEIKKAASRKAGGVGIRYLVSISNEEMEVYDKKCHLWFEKGVSPELWFVVEE